MHQPFWQRLNKSSRCRSFLLLALCGGAGLAAPPASLASPPDERAYELVSPPNMQGTSVRPVQSEEGAANAPKSSSVASDGSAMLWYVVTAPPGASDSTGLWDYYRSVRGEDAWHSTYVGLPGAAGGPNQDRALVKSASTDLNHLLFLTFNTTIDPTDPDPVETAPYNEAFPDLYTREPEGLFARVTRGSLDLPGTPGLVVFIGASQHLGNVLFMADRQLEPDAAPQGGIYQRDGQTTRLVSKDETGTPLPGFYDLKVLASSADGSAVAFTPNGIPTLYIWSDRTGETVKAVGPLTDLTVDSMSADGRKTVFSTSSTLVAHDTDTSADLYEYDAVTGDITLLSVPSGGGARGNSDACAAALPGASQCDVAGVITAKDGSAEYFVSPEQLVAGLGVDGAVNLYLSAQGAIRFVATLDPTDPIYGFGTFGFNSAQDRYVRLTADGTRLVFESRTPLTSYDNAGHTEVYLYDSVAGAITCASCRPSGAPPTGDSTLSALGDGAHADAHGNRVFFNSLDAIVPEDTNNRLDVYEYSVAGGTPALISSGTGGRDSTYVGNGLDGRDVFFQTTDTLVPQDLNGNVYKMYDARIRGGFPPPLPPDPACQGAACRPGQTAPQPAPLGVSPTARGLRRTQPEAVVSRLAVPGSRSVKGTSLHLTAKVSGSGRLTVTGSGLVVTPRKTSRAASYHLSVRLSKASAAELRRTHRLTLSATVRFVPSKGTARSVRLRLTFTAPSNRNAR